MVFWTGIVTVFLSSADKAESTYKRQLNHGDTEEIIEKFTYYDYSKKVKHENLTKVYNSLIFLLFFLRVSVSQW